MKKKICVNNIYIIKCNILKIVRDFDIRRNNMILYQKLYEIDKNGRQSISKSLKPVFRFKKNQREIFVKNGIRTLAQENLFILKKLLSKNSEYNFNRMEKEYQQSQKYKQNICHYPSINFHTYSAKDSNAPIVQSYQFQKEKTKKDDKNKLPKIGGVTIKSTFRVFRTTHGNMLDEIYYKEATRSSKMNSTTKSKFKNTRYGNTKRLPKEQSDIDEASNEGSSSGKGDDNSDNRSGSGDGSGSGEGSGSGSGDGDGSGSGSGSGSD